MSAKTDFETSFSELGRNIDAMVDDTQHTYEKEKQELKTRWAELDAKRKAIADDSESAWEQAKSDMDDGMNNLQSNFADLKRKLEE